MAFWLPSYRAFKTFVGELTAASAAVETAVRHTAQTLKDATGSDPWGDLAKTVGITLSGMESSRAQLAAARLELVGTYAGFDAFIRELRADGPALRCQPWNHSKGDTPVEEVRRNLPSGTLVLGTDECALDYYRVCRNAIVHPSDENSKTSSDYFREHHTDLADVRDRWQSVGHGKAPGAPMDLSFADVKLFARVALHVAEQISAAFDPGDDVLLALVPKDSWKHLAHDCERRINAAAGRLQMQYRLDADRARSHRS